MKQNAPVLSSRSSLNAEQRYSTDQRHLAHSTISSNSEGVFLMFILMECAMLEAKKKKKASPIV